MLHRHLLPFVGLFGLFAAAPLRADNVNLAPVADIRILSFFPNTNEGLGTLLSVYTQPGNVQRTLLQFDLTGIPNGAQIDSAVLTLIADEIYGGDNPSNLNMDVHALTKPWIELQVTWNSASTGAPWATPGGDFDPFVYATSTANPDAGEPATWDITDLVRNWHDGSINNDGLIIKSFTGNGLGFEGINQADTSLHPKLAITYSVVPEPSSIVLMGIGAAVLIGVVGRKRRAEG